MWVKPGLGARRGALCGRCICYPLVQSKNTPKLTNLNQHKYLSHVVSMGQEFESSTSGWFCFGVSCEIAVRAGAGAASPEGLTQAGEAAS